LVSTAIVAFSERYTERLATQRIKARLSRALTWTFVVPRQDGRHRRPNNDRNAAPTDPDDYASNGLCASPRRVASPLSGGMSAGNGGAVPTGFRQKPDIVSAARRATGLGREDRFLVSKRYGVVSNWDQNRPNTKHDQISTKRIPDDHDGTEFQP
jgi:hypothetical protein